MPVEQSRIIHLQPSEAASRGQREIQQGQSQDIVPKPSRIPQKTIALIEHTHAAGLDKRLDERRRQLLTHLAANPHKTLQELASIAGITTAERVRQLCESGLKELWQALPLEDQQQYPLAELLRRIQGVGRPPLSPERKARLIEVNTGRRHTPEHTAKIVAANTGRRHSPETRARMSAAQKGRQISPEHRARLSDSARKSWEREEVRMKRVKKPTPETRVRMSAAQRKRHERRRQQQAEQPTQVFPPVSE